MFTSIRQSTRRLRAVFFTAVAMLLLVSVLEAGHDHGVFAPSDDHCALCQHAFSLDKPVQHSTSLVLLLALVFTGYLFHLVFTQALTCRFTAIRAPPH